MPLRPYQRTYYDRTCHAYDQGARAVLLVAPTGSGKTCIGGEFVLRAVHKGECVLWLAHRSELLAQARARLLADGVPRVGVISASYPELEDPGAPVQVASVQTLLARGLLPKAALVVLDEAHHFVAREFFKIADAYRSAFRLGLTATPERADGSPLGDLFDSLVCETDPRQLTQAGYLVPCEVFAPSENLKGDLALDPSAAWKYHSNGRKTLVFARDLDHAQRIKASLIGLGSNVRLVSGKTPHDLRAMYIAQFTSGEIDTLVNVFVLTEGTDLPNAEVCIIARSCASASVFLQIVGRVLRPHPGKARATLVDLCGAVHLHGLPDDPRAYGLHGKGKGIQGLPDLPGLRLCLGCGATFRYRPECPRCGFANPPPDPPRIRHRELMPVLTSAPVEQRQKEYARLKQQAEEKGYSAGWVSHRYKARFGVWPPFGGP